MNSLHEEKAQSGAMFTRIHARYDLLNHLLTAGLDIRWRKLLVHALEERLEEDPQHIRLLDIATGTGDLAILLQRRYEGMRITGSDISEGMLARARMKTRKKGMDRLQLMKADAADLPFEKRTFDFVTVAFGVRNFPRLEHSFNEVLRVLKPGGFFYILEFGWPASRLLSFLYRVYSHTVIPLLGRLVAGDRKAYGYLTKTIRTFPYGEALVTLLEQAGFEARVAGRPAGGIVCLYEAKRPDQLEM